MKTCKSCNTEKPDSEFYVGAAKCKPCTCAHVRANREKKILDPVWRAWERERCRIKQARRREFLKAHGIKEGSRAAINTRWRSRNREKQRAHSAAHKAVLSGKIQNKPACQKCGAPPPLEMHHEDYSKPLDVLWLCIPCHALTRRKGDAPITRRIAA